MTKAASAEIGSKRWYHHVPPAAPPCACSGTDIDPDCAWALLSVTTILKALPKEWLASWAAKLTAQLALDELAKLQQMLDEEGREAVERYLKGAPWRKRDAAAERGSAAHKAAEEGTAIEDVPEDARGRVLGWHRWLDDYAPDIEWQEATIYNPFEGYAGTIDIIARVPRSCACHTDPRWLIDIKTGFAPTLEQRFQQAAYRYGSFIGDERGDYRAGVPEVEHVGILKLNDDGYSFFEVQAGPDEYRAFLDVAKVGRWLARLDRVKPRLVGER